MVQLNDDVRENGDGTFTITEIFFNFHCLFFNKISRLFKKKLTGWSRKPDGLVTVSGQKRKIYCISEGSNFVLLEGLIFYIGGQNYYIGGGSKLLHGGSIFRLT